MTFRSLFRLFGPETIQITGLNQKIRHLTLISEHNLNLIELKKNVI